MFSMIPGKVQVCECWARDGLQGEATVVPTDVKVAMINRFTEIGFKRIEVTSFAHPKLVKQFADSFDVLQKIDRRPDVTYIAIVPNDKGLDRAIEACDKGFGIQEITAILSASQPHLLANLEKTFEEAMPPLGKLVSRARSFGLKVIGCIGTAFGCPLAGEVPLQKVIELTDWYLEQGATSIMLGDTTGEANPVQVHEVFSTVRDRFPETDFIAHFHDTRGMGLANTLAALQAGITLHDSSFGGIGGQPATNRPIYHKGLTGNAATEDLVCMFNDMGVETGLPSERILAAGQEVEVIAGKELYGHTARSGICRSKLPRVLDYDFLKEGMEFAPTFFRVTRELLDRQGLGQRLPEAVVKVPFFQEKEMPGPVLDERYELKAELAPGEILLTYLTVGKKFQSGSRNCVSLKGVTKRSNSEVAIESELTVAWD